MRRTGEGRGLYVRDRSQRRMRDSRARLIGYGIFRCIHMRDEDRINHFIK